MTGLEFPLPGSKALLGAKAEEPGIFLLKGPTGCGKSVYSRNLIEKAAILGYPCVIVNAVSSKKRQDAFLNQLKVPQESSIKLVGFSPGTDESLLSDADRISSPEQRLSQLLGELRTEIIGKSRDGRPSCVVLDSISSLSLFYGETPTSRFLAELLTLMHDSGAIGLFTSTTNESTNTSEDTPTRIIANLSEFFDGTIEIRMRENGNVIEREIRTLMIQGKKHDPKWIKFQITEEGRLLFTEEKNANLKCMLCGKTIKDNPYQHSNLYFDSLACLETYKKMDDVYGSAAYDIGLPKEAANVSFFFVDIVGLSDPSMSVQTQLKKIDTLIQCIASCDVFARTPREKRLVLPTGDGMAIGFLSSAESPLLLSIQVQEKMREYNRHADQQIGIRIGLNSGPVFTVTDMNGNQNVWGPGIILARRVMDIGDDGHILLGEKFAEELIALRDEYKEIIRLIDPDYQIKHGQRIKVYSCYSNDFGNPNLPVRMKKIT